MALAKRATIGVSFHVNQSTINQFEHSLKDINRTNTTLRDAFSRTNSELDRFDEHMNRYAGRYGEIAERIKQHNNSIGESAERLNERLRRSSDTYRNNSARYNEANRRMDESSRERSEQQQRDDDSIKRSFESLRTSMNGLKNSLDTNNREMTQSTKRMADAQRAESDQIKANAERMKNSTRGIGTSAQRSANSVTSANGRIARAFNTSNQSIIRHGAAIKTAQSRDHFWLHTAQDMSGATLGLGAAFYHGAKAAASLQQSYVHAGNMAHFGGERMSEVQRDINQQYKVGTALSERYGVSQNQIAQGYQTLIARGYTTTEALHAQKTMIQASIASGDDYNDVVNNSSNIIDAFGLRTKNAAQMSANAKTAVNQMAFAADQTATNFKNLGYGMAYVGATAHTTHQSISETSSALGILSNKGMQASMAGTGLRKVLNSFLSINKKGQQAQVMQQLGLTEQDFKTPKGNLKSLSALMTILNNKTKLMDSQQRGAIFHRFFGATGQEAALNLASDTKGLKKLNNEVSRSQNMGHGKGYVALLSQHNMKSAQNQLHVFEQAWNAFTITAAREILPTLTGVLKHLDVLIGDMNKMPAAAKKWTVFGALAVAAIAPISLAIFGVKSAFHGLEYSALRVRSLFSKPMPSGMTHSIDRQTAQVKADSKVMDSGSKATGLSKIGIGLNKARSVATSPAVSLAAAGTLAVGMGAYMGHNANVESARQTRAKMQHVFQKPIQESIKAQLDQTSVRQSLMGNKRLSRQLEKQNKSTYGNISNQLAKATRDSENASLKNTRTLRKYGIINKRQADRMLHNDENAEKQRYKNADNALKQISRDEQRSHGKMTKATMDDYKRAYAAINRVIAGNGSKESQIYKKLQAANGRISTKTAAELLRNSYKAYRGQVRNANSDYNATKSAAQKRYEAVTKAAADEYGTSSSAYRKIRNSAAATRDSTIKSAETKRTMTIKAASEEHDRIISEAEDQCKHISSAVDVGTGHVITEWSKMKSWLGSIGSDIEGICSKVASSLNNLLGGLPGKIGNVIGDLNSAASKAGSFGKGHANGGAISQDEMSLVNERGQESAYNPHTNTFRMLGNNGPQVVKLYAGEHVLDAQDTHELLTTGLGRGVTLPGYANGTDKLSNIRGVIPGYAYGTGRGGAIERTVAHQSPTTQNIEGTAANDGISTTASWLNIPGDLTSGGSTLQRLASAAADTPAGMLGHFAEGPLNALRSVHAAMHPISHLVDFAKAPLHGAVRKLGHLIDPSAVNANFKKLAPAIGKGLDYGLSKAKSAVHNGIQRLSNNARNIKRKMQRGWNGLKRFGRGIGNQIAHSRIGRAIGKLGHNIGRTVGRAWRGLKRGAGRALRGARRLGRNALRGVRRFGRNMGRGAKRLWRGAQRLGRNAMRGVRRFGRNFGRGLRRFGRNTLRTGRRMFRRAQRGIRRFGRGVLRSGKRIMRRGHRMLTRAGRDVKRTGRRMLNSAKRTGRGIWNSAKRVGRNVWNDAKRVGRNVGRTASRLWSATKSGASGTWSAVRSGASRLWSATKSAASNLWSGIHSGASRTWSTVRSTASSLWSSVKSHASAAWSGIKSGASTAVSVAKSILGGLLSFAEHVKAVIESIPHHLPHFANGGPIQQNEMALVGERGPETAYNTRTGSVRFLGTHGPQITTLLAGERVLTNTQTERLLHGGLGRGTIMPGFANGKGNSAAELDNSDSHSPSSNSTDSITATFSGIGALRKMLKFGKDSKDIWSDISDNVVSAVQDAHSKSSDEWSGMSKDVDAINNKLSKKTNDTFNDMGNSVQKIAENLMQGLIDAAKDTASGFGDKFSKLIDYAKDDVKDVIKAINRGISGIDTALRSFGGNSHVIHEIHYAKGTMNGHIAYPQLGILNDATSGPRQEAVVRGGNIMLPQGDDVRFPLQRGDAVLNGEQTKQLINNTTVNHYASGSGLHLSDKFIKALTHTLNTGLKKPVEFIRKSVGNDLKPEGHSFTKGMESLIAKPTVKLAVPWTRAMFGYIKNLLTPDQDSGGSSNSVLLNEMHKLGDGHTYLWGAAGPNHYDCGGLVMAALHALGMPSEHTVYPYPTIPASEATTGDIVQSATHVGVVANKDHTKYFSAYGPNLAPDSIKTQPLTNEYFTPGHPFYFRRPWKLYHEDQRNAARKNGASHKSGNFLQNLVKSELGPSAIAWLKKAASLIGGGADLGAGAVDTMKIPGAPGSWTKAGTQAHNIAKAVYTSALSLGLDAKHAAAMVGNAWHESAGFEYGLMVNQFGGGGGKGLFQFTGQPSKEGWTPIGQDKSILANAMPEQTAAWKHEQGSPYKLAEDFETIFERGSIPAYAERAQAAETAYHMFAANGGWADKTHPRVFGEAGPEVAINPNRDTADHLIVEAIGARMRASHDSPIAGLVKSIGIRGKRRSLINDVHSLMDGAVNSKPKQKNANPIKINVTNNININGNPNANQSRQITHNVERAIQRGIQHAALHTRNRLEW